MNIRKCKLSTLYIRDRLIDEGASEETAKAFIHFHRNHVHIWKAFIRATFKAIFKGERKGAKGIYEDLREDPTLAGGKDFKVSNSFTSCYARVFAWTFPDHKDYFSYRPMGSSKNTEVSHADN